MGTSNVQTVAVEAENYFTEVLTLRYARAGINAHCTELNKRSTEELTTESALSALVYSKREQ
jgi:hypothetical protein